MSAKRKKRSTFWIAALLLAVVLIVIALLAVVVKCAKDDGSEDDPPIGKDPEVVVELDKSNIVFGGGAEASVPPAGPQDPDPDPDPDPGKADFTLSAEELLYVPGGEAGATLTATKAGVTWTAEWEDPASGWAAGKAVTDLCGSPLRAGRWISVIWRRSGRGSRSYVQTAAGSGNACAAV